MKSLYVLESQLFSNFKLKRKKKTLKCLYLIYPIFVDFYFLSNFNKFLTIFIPINVKFLMNKNRFWRKSSYLFPGIAYKSLTSTISMTFCTFLIMKHIKYIEKLKFLKLNFYVH